VGREEELASLLALLDASDGLPAVAVVTGEAGIGKTALWLAAVEAAEARGYLVLSCRPAEAEAAFSFVALADLIGGVVPDVLPELPPIQQRALDAALLLGEAEGSTDEHAVAAAFLGALRFLAADRSLLLAVDDVQWLDAASLAVLRYALARIDHEPVAALLAVRGDVPAWLRRAVPEERLQAVEIGGLSVGAIHELLRTRLDAAFSRPILIRVWETSGGNPFLALELAGALQRRGGTLAPGEELPIPSNLDELLLERLDNLRAAALDVARVVASLAHPTVPLVESAVRRRFDAGLAEALSARILELDGERLRFTHPLLGSAVAARQTPARRRSLHARLATIVPTAEERARHLALATAAPSREVASILEEASRAAHARGAPATAAELAEESLRLTPNGDSGNARRRLLAAADRHHEAGDSDRALALLEEARTECPPGAARAAVLFHLAEVRYGVTGPYAALELHRQAIAETAGDHGLEADIHLAAAMCLRLTESVDSGLEHAEAAVRAASRAGDETLMCRALAAFGLLHFDAGRGSPHGEMERALELERPLPEPRQFPATQILAHQLSWSGDLEGARSSYHTVLASWAARDDPYQFDPLFQLALIEWRAGDWEAAVQCSDQAIEIMQEAGRDGWLPILQLPGTTIAAHRGHVEEARRRSKEALADTRAAGNRAAESAYTDVLGFIDLSLGNHSVALRHLRRAADLRDELGVREPGMRHELGDLLEALIAVGELDEADEILATWQDRAGALDRAWALAILARCRGLLLAARGDLEDAFASFERALAEHARTSDPFQHARTLLAQGATQRRAKQRGAARLTLEQALALFERLGAPLWAEQARAELKRIGGRAPSRDELTEAERRIAALVAEGRTNREVAAALFVTEHTVEGALTRVYRKLGVRSRTELAHRLKL
jgi:DNA-binding CsgD family transcriptional regulator